MMSILGVFLLAALAAAPAQAQTNNTGVPTNITSITNLTTVWIYDRPPPMNISGQLYNYTADPVVRQVAWFPAGNLAIVDGDIIFGTVADLQAARVPQDGNTKRAFSLFNTASAKWPGGVFRYKWASQSLKDRKGRVWDQGVKMWTDRLPFLEFKEEFPPSEVLDTTSTVVTLVDRADVCPGCSFSWVGRAQSGEANTLILGDCGECAASYAHEIGHSLGLHHEHQRPDRNEYIDVHCENVDDQTKDGATTKAVCDPAPGDQCAGWGCAFAVQPFGFADFSTPYDTESLMHYRSTAFCRPENCQKTITSKNGRPDPVDGTAPSKIDAIRICELYSPECTSVCGNDVLEPGEQCDDGNNVDGDGCAANCKLEPGCGNGILEPGEQCDYGTLNGQPEVACDKNCKKINPCPLQTCDPRPGKNLCHVTSSCTRIEDSLAWSGTPTFLCACAAGFRGNVLIPADLSQEIRIPGDQWPSQRGRVFVKPGVECNQMCSDRTLGADGCTEVSVSAACFKP